MARKAGALDAERQTLQRRKSAAAASQGLGVHQAPADPAALGSLANEVHGMNQGSARVVAALPAGPHTAPGAGTGGPCPAPCSVQLLPDAASVHAAQAASAAQWLQHCPAPPLGMGSVR